MSEADVNVPSAQEEKGVKAYAEHDEQKDKPVDAEKDEQKEKHDDADSDTGVKKQTKKKKQEESAEEASAAGKQKKEYKTEELKRLQEILKKEKSHIRKPKQRAHFPFVWTSLEPYYNTHTAAFLIDLHGEERPETVSRSRTIQTPEEFRHNYISRNTAQGLCDPWVDLRMDHDILPKIGSAQRTSTRGTYSLERSKEQKKEKDSKEKKREQQGSTRLPKFPVVPFHTGKENATMRFPYQDIPKFRQEMDQRFSLNAPQKVDKDYKRTKDDFYRMELDKLDDVHPLNRPHMRKAYFAYLQNTPGSKKAITECVRSLDGSQQHQKSGSAPRVS